MPSERILNKLFEIAQENTSEEVNYNDFVKDVLNSADLTFEDKTYNVEDEYLRNLLALAKHDGRIFGEYKNGKFVISESIIKSAKKETQRQFDIKREKADNAQKAEKDNPFGTINEMIKSFKDLDLDGKLKLIRSVGDMTREQFGEYAKETKEYISDCEKNGLINKAQVAIANEALEEQEIAYFGTAKDKKRVADIKLELCDMFTFNAIKGMLMEGKYVPGDILRSFKKNIENRNQVSEYEEILSIIDKRLEEEKDVSRNQNDEIRIKDIEFYDNFMKRYSSDKIESTIIDIERIKNLDNRSSKGKTMISNAMQEYLDAKKMEFRSSTLLETKKRVKSIIESSSKIKQYTISEASLENLEKKFFNPTINDDVEEKKASEVPGLEDIGVFANGISGFGFLANGDIMTSFGEEAPVTDLEFAEAFDMTEIGRVKTEESKNIDTSLEEELEMGEGSVLPSNIKIEKINSDAVSPVREDDKLDRKSVIKFTEAFVRSSSYLKKMKDVKEFAHAGIDINKTNQIDEIA